MTTDPIALLRELDEDNWISIPSTDNVERRSRCNEILQAIDAIIREADDNIAQAWSDEELAVHVNADDEPKRFVLAEAARRLRTSSGSSTGDSNV